MNRTRLVAFAALLLAGAGFARAERFYTDEKALQELLPGADKIEKVVRPVTADELAAVKKQLGGVLAAYGKPGPDPKEFVFYFGMKDGKKTGAALFDTQPGKWGAICFAIGLDAATGKITNMMVTTMSEKRGRPIALKSFLKQFFGKDKTAAFAVGKDVNAVAGATISAKAAAFAARKAVALYEMFFSRK